ncbi:MAG: peptidoglycan DD-metalloendopeptidase family protein [Ruminococcus sp.]|jgi:murein DD-endopeptidase MepM/ murein hydrolase activator NlpD|nr:peptidoglycan DD-metalloendopeptidase family protein [Ruminococcus sp.]
MKRVSFKKITAIAVAAVCAMALSSSVFAEDMESLQQKQKELAAAIEENEKQIAQLGEQAKETEEYIRIYDEKMKAQEELVASLGEQIAIYQDDIDRVSAKIEATEKDVADGIYKFRQRLRAIYMSGGDNLTSVITGADSFYDILAGAEFIKRVAQSDNELINGLNEEIGGLNADIAELTALKTDMEDTLAAAKLEQSRLNQTYNGHRDTLAMKQAMLNDYNARGDELEKQEAAAEKALEDFIKAEQERLAREAAEKAAREAAERAAAEAAGKTPPAASKTYASYSNTGFIWPVPSVHNMSDGYGNRWIIEEQRNQFHKGIDITKPGCAGELIVAAAGGTVIQAGNNSNGYGNCVIIDHGNSVSTLYAHMSSTVTSIGAVVNQGDPIGYIGHTGNAYGDHLHFEVRVKGQHTEPLDYVGY